MCGTATAVECRYAPKTAAGSTPPELAGQGACGELSGPDDFRIAREHLARLSFRGGLAELHVDDRVYYVDRRGRAVRVHRFDNGADYFSEGLARTVARGKFGYVDRKLRVVIKPAFDFAFPFANGRAIVCLGCAVVAEGEHQSLQGGKWGMIDRSGVRIVALRHSLQQVQAMQRPPRRMAQ
jgi:hypothetical protein